MIHHRRTLDEMDDDLSTVKAVEQLLCNAADAISAANVQLRRAKELAATINDPALRRLALSCAGELKANTNNFFPEEPCTPSSARSAKRRSRKSPSRTARAATTTTST